MTELTGSPRSYFVATLQEVAHPRLNMRVDGAIALAFAAALEVRLPAFEHSVELVAHYPPEVRIRVVLDNHSAHISKETMAWLASHPGRFEYVHTPKHGSWLNLVEFTFSKMARSFLRHIRVSSLDDLTQRILKGIEEIFVR